MMVERDELKRILKADPVSQTNPSFLNKFGFEYNVYSGETEVDLIAKTSINRSWTIDYEQAKVFSQTEKKDFDDPWSIIYFVDLNWVRDSFIFNPDLMDKIPKAYTSEKEIISVKDVPIKKIWWFGRLERAQGI